QLEKKQRLHVPVPILLRPATQRAAADHSGAIIVGAKKDGARVWNFDGNDRNVRLEELRRDDRRNMLVCLKFEYETDAFLDQQVGIVECGFRTVPVIDCYQLQVFTGSNAMDALIDVARKFRIRRLRGETQFECRIRQRLHSAAISPFSDAVNHAADDEALKQSETGGLA